MILNLLEKKLKQVRIIKIHGIGISSIKYIVSKYKGEVLVNYSKMSLY